MRIIHTSDWHLGQYFYTKSRAPEHRAFLQWLIERIEEHRVDALIVAGDIFDTGSPPSYARELYNRFVVDLQKTGCQLVILGGNHDSVATLNESRQLLSCLNAAVIASVNDDELQEQVIVLNLNSGERSQPAAILCAVPFLRPRDIIASQAGQSAEEKQQCLQRAIQEHYETLYQQALQLRERLNLPLPIIATGHLTTVGVSASDAEREIYIGTLEAYPAQAFPPFDYIALGHIHRAQIVAKSDHIRYSGSPIALSFDELDKVKSVYLVEFGQDVPANVTALDVPVFQPMRLIKGSLEEIAEQLQTFATMQTDKPVWLDIEVISQDYLGDLQRQIQTITADLPVEVLLLRRSKEQRQKMIVRQEKETLAELTIDEVFDRRLALELFESETELAKKQRLTLAFKQVVAEITDEMAQDKRQNRQSLIQGADE